MRTSFFAAIFLAGMSSTACFAVEGGNPPAVASSSSAALPSAPLAAAAPLPGPAAEMSFAQAISGTTATRPFSGLGVAVKAGAEGIGFDLATPVARKFNVRGGASFFSYTHALTESGIHINPDLQFRKMGASLDWFPFNNGFRLSPGFVFYNGNHATATAQVPGGQTFTLNDTNYTSSPSDPVHGSAEVTFGHKQAPSFTVGWGNIVPRTGHWSVPFEVGFEYIGPPAFVYNLAGTACNQFGCMNVQTSPDIQANLKAEQDKLNSDISPLRFYPILTIGIGYKF